MSTTGVRAPLSVGDATVSCMRIKTLLAGTALLATAVCSSGCSGSAEPKAEPSVQVDVKIELRWPYIANTLSMESEAPEECAGGRNYSRINTASVLTIRDADGHAVGSVKLAPPKPSDNLVICTWEASLVVRSASKTLSATVGGWTSEPMLVEGRTASFRLDTVDEDPAFGSTARIDPGWTEAGS